MQVSGQQCGDDLLARIQQVTDREPDRSRVRLSRQVCHWLNGRAPNGTLKEMSGRVAGGRAHLSSDQAGLGDVGGAMHGLL